MRWSLFDMTTPINIKKGLRLHVIGTPRNEVSDVARASKIVISPLEFTSIKPRLQVKEGESIKRGTVLFTDKKNELFKFRSPASGTITEIVYGKRRVIEQIVIERGSTSDAEPLEKFSVDQIKSLDGGKVLNHLFDTGLIALIKERPFSGTPKPDSKPKSIFVNGMHTAPFLADIEAAVEGQETAFQAGLNALGRLTEGSVHLCLEHDVQKKTLLEADGVKVHTFKGPHPAGNTSVHISRIDPFEKGDIIWTLRAVDVILIGQLLLDGTIPDSRIVSLGGSSIKEEARKHYRVQLGAPLHSLLDGKTDDRKSRVVSGDLFAGANITDKAFLPYLTSSITVIPEDRERRFMGWLAPGFSVFSRSRAFLTPWIKPGAKWELTTSQRGSHRAMVLTGLYDKYMPLNIMVDYLVRAVLAHDTDEAVRLGILETDPEDFALCSFVCPSKMDIVGIIRSGLREIEKEGL